MYIGVLAVGLIDALIAQFRPLVMDSALFVTALSQAFLTEIALVAEKGLNAFAILMINGFFIILGRIGFAVSTCKNDRQLAG
jgi:hypothetical protein